MSVAVEISRPDKVLYPDTGITKAGVVDETLWRARLAPQRDTTDLSRSDFSRLHDRMATVVRHGTDAERVPDRASWLTGRRDVPDGACPRCDTRLEHGRVDGRSTVWCPHCQPG